RAGTRAVSHDRRRLDRALGARPVRRYEWDRSPAALFGVRRDPCAQRSGTVFARRTVGAAVAVDSGAFVDRPRAGHPRRARQPGHSTSAGTLSRPISPPLTWRFATHPLP